MFINKCVFLCEFFFSTLLQDTFYAWFFFTPGLCTWITLVWQWSRLPAEGLDTSSVLRDMFHRAMLNDFYASLFWPIVWLMKLEETRNFCPTSPRVFDSHPASPCLPSLSGAFLYRAVVVHHYDGLQMYAKKPSTFSATSLSLGYVYTWRVTGEDKTGNMLHTLFIYFSESQNPWCPERANVVIEKRW